MRSRGAVSAPPRVLSEEMRTATSVPASLPPRPRQRLRLGFAVAAILAVCATPTATGQSIAGTEHSQLGVRSAAGPDGRSLTAISLESSESVGRASIFVPQGYTLDLARPVGAAIGELYVSVRDVAGGIGGDFVNGAMVVDDPMRYARDPRAQECAPGAHATVWRASLASRARTLELAIFVDPTGGADPAGAAYVLRLCPVWPSTTVGVAHLIADGFGILVEQGLASPANPGRYAWSALVAPASPGSFVAEPSRAFEVRSVVPLPQSLTLRAKHDPKAKSVVLRGKLTALGQPRAGVPIDLSGYSPSSDGFTDFGSVRTNAAGEFSIRRKIARTTQFLASADAEAGPCKAPSTAPQGCVSESVTPPSPARAAVVVRRKTDAKLAVRRADRVQAREANLKPSDFPPGWTSFPQLTPLELCPTYAPNLSKLTSTGEAQSPIFLTGETSAAASRSAVYATDAEARTAFGKEAVRAVADCIADDARANGGATVQAVGSLSFPRLGEQTRAFRIVVSDPNGDLYLDLVSFRRGRVVVHLVFSSLGGPLDIERSLVAAVAARTRTR